MSKIFENVNLDNKYIKKSKKTILDILFGRVIFILLALLLQLSFFVVIVTLIWEIFPYILFIILGIPFIVAIFIIYSNKNPNEKILWLDLLIGLPIFGVLIYFYINSTLGHNKTQKQLIKIKEKTKKYIIPNASLDNINKEIKNLSNYINNYGGYAVCNNTDVLYLDSGEEKFKHILKELEKAQKFIFLEYFIIKKGYMWDEILEVLKRKAKEGVEVRVLYDGTCTLYNLPTSYAKELESYSIKCRVFEPIKLFISSKANFRDHRKILIVDGKVAFNGGINIADEYININSPFGHWKDSAVLIKGDAVNCFTKMFLEMWDVNHKLSNYYKYINTNNDIKKEGLVIPFGDSPHDKEHVGKKVYLDIINTAKEYVYIMTPYLIIDDEIENALIYASKRGVDIKIIIPSIPDKKLPYLLAQSHFKRLVLNNVEIYKYIPGFIHSKIFLSDNNEAVVGTINLDYRSLHHHFECATYMYKVNAIKDIKQDFIKTINVSRKVTPKDINSIKVSDKIKMAILKVYAPLM